jgi:hypothetical protein
MMSCCARLEHNDLVQWLVHRRRRRQYYFLERIILQISSRPCFVEITVLIYHQGFDLASDTPQVPPSVAPDTTNRMQIHGVKAGTKLGISAVGCQYSGSVAFNNVSIVHTLLVLLH